MVSTSKADRLRKSRMGAKFKSASEAARSLGVSTATYIHHENGTRDFGEAAAAIYARRFHVSQSWLLLGEGEMDTAELAAEKAAALAEKEEQEREYFDARAAMTVEQRQKVRETEKHWQEQAVLKAAKDLAFVPEISPSFTRTDPYDSFHGWKRYVDLDDAVFHPVVSTWGIPENHLQFELGSSPTRTILFPVIGNANAPVLSHGDIAIVDTSQDDVVADAFYLVADKVAQPQVRRLRINLFSNPTTVTMFAEATPEERQILEMDALSIVGKVAGRISRL